MTEKERQNIIASKISKPELESPNKGSFLAITGTIALTLLLAFGAAKSKEAKNISNYLETNTLEEMEGDFAARVRVEISKVLENLPFDLEEFKSAVGYDKYQEAVEKTEYLESVNNKLLSLFDNIVLDPNCEFQSYPTIDLGDGSILDIIVSSGFKSRITLSLNDGRKIDFLHYYKSKSGIELFIQEEDKNPTYVANFNHIGALYYLFDSQKVNDIIEILKKFDEKVFINSGIDLEDLIKFLQQNPGNQCLIPKKEDTKLSGFLKE